MLSPSHPHDFHAVFQTVCTTSPLASRTGARSFKGVNVVQRLCRFAAALQQLLAARDSAAFERVWDALGRRSFAFLGIAERHPDAAWPLCERYLVTPGAHHAFVAAAVEATRYYSGRADVLISLFERIRGDQLLRRFLGPKILESLYVLGEERSLPLFEQLLVAGHTDPDIDRCEVIRALVAVRKLTGRVAPSAKFADAEHAVVQRALDDAERRFDQERDRIVPVTVI